MVINPELQREIEKTVPKAAQGKFVEDALKTALTNYKAAHTKIVELFVDGGSRGNPGSSGGGFAAYFAGKKAAHGSEYFGEKTNNQAEYLALRMALRELFEKYADYNIHCFMDSQLVVEQMSGNYKVKSADLRPLFDEVQRITGQFRSFQIKHVERNQNKVADRLANEAMDNPIPQNSKS